MSEETKREEKTFLQSTAILGKGMRDAFYMSSPIIAILALSLLAVVIGLRSKASSRYMTAASNFDSWQTQATEEAKRGSDIGIANLFSSSRDGLARLNSITQNEQLPKQLVLEFERLGVEIKLPILKKAISVEPKRKNYSFQIVELKERILYKSENTKRLKSFTIVGKYNKYTSLDLYRSQTSSQFTTFFKIYLEPGMSIRDLNQLNPEIILETSGEKTSIPISECKLEFLGSREAPSPLIELTIPLGSLRNGQLVSISIDVPEIMQTGDLNKGLIPFSIYDVHVERYALGISKVHTILEFDNNVILEGICFCAKSLAHRKCREEEIKIIKPIGYNWNRPIPTKRFEFELRYPEDPIAIAFYRYDH